MGGIHSLLITVLTCVHTCVHIVDCTKGMIWPTSPKELSDEYFMVYTTHIRTGVPYRKLQLTDPDLCFVIH